MANDTENSLSLLVREDIQDADPVISRPLEDYNDSLRQNIKVFQYTLNRILELEQQNKELRALIMEARSTLSKWQVTDLVSRMKTELDKEA